MLNKLISLLREICPRVIEELYIHIRDLFSFYFNHLGNFHKEGQLWLRVLRRLRNKIERIVRNKNKIYMMHCLICFRDEIPMRTMFPYFTIIKALSNKIFRRFRWRFMNTSCFRFWNWLSVGFPLKFEGLKIMTCFLQCGQKYGRFLYFISVKKANPSRSTSRLWFIGWDKSISIKTQTYWPKVLSTPDLDEVVSMHIDVPT